MRCIVYVRISKDDLRHLAGSSREEKVLNHLRECREYAADKDWEIVEEFVDSNIPASEFSKKPRPEYQRMLRWIPADTGDTPVVLLTTEIERLYRQVEEVTADIIPLHRTTMLTHIYTTDDATYDLRTPEGRHSLIAVVNNSQRESGKVSVRQRRRQKRRAQEGRYQGPEPFGYRYEATGELVGGRPIRRLAIDEDQAALIRDAASRVLAGTSIRSIQRDWHDRGVRTRPTSRTPEGKPFEHVQVRRTLINPLYAGLRVHRPAGPQGRQNSHPEKLGETYPGDWPAILDMETHEALRDLLLTPGRKAYQGAIRTHLLTGIIRCGECGAKLRAQTEKAPRRTYYKCPPPNEGHLCVGRAEAPLNELIKAYVIHWLRPGGPYADYLAAARPRDADHTDRLAQLRRADADLTRRMAEVEASRRLPDDDPHRRTPKEVREDLAVLGAEREEINKQLRRLHDRSSTTPATLEVGLTADQWDAMSFAQQREYIERLFRSILVHKTEKGRLQFDSSKVTVEAGVWADGMAPDALLVPFDRAPRLRRQIVAEWLYDHPGEVVSPTMIARATGLDVGHISKVLKELPPGTLEVVQAGRGNRPWLYRCLEAKCDVA